MAKKLSQLYDVSACVGTTSRYLAQTAQWHHAEFAQHYLKKRGLPNFSRSTFYKWRASARAEPGSKEAAPVAVHIFMVEAIAIAMGRTLLSVRKDKFTRRTEEGA